ASCSSMPPTSPPRPSSSSSPAGSAWTASAGSPAGSSPRTRAAPPAPGSPPASGTPRSSGARPWSRGGAGGRGAWGPPAAGARRILGTAVNIFLSPVFTAGDSGDTAVAELLLPEDPEVRALARRLAEEESARGSVDRGWVLGFIATLFAIHVGRMGFDRTF